jgi:flagellar hook-associated protein 1 FlgK
VADLFQMLGRATQALDAQRYGLDVAGQNIANVNTPGYVRRSVNLVELPPPDPSTPGGGVAVQSVDSARAPLVEARLRYEQPLAGRESAIAEQLAVVEAGLGQPGASLDAALSQFYNTYGALAQNPTSSTARQQVVVQGQSLSRAFNDMAARFDTVRHNADNDIRASVAQVNALAAQLADINKQIGQTDPQSAQGLLDQQSAVIKSLSTFVDLNVTTRSDNAVDVSIGNGRALVIGDTTFELRTAPQADGYLSLVSDGAAVPTDVTTEITGGRIGGMLQVRDTLMPQYTASLDQLAYSVSTDVNSVVSTGYDLQGHAGVDFFTAPAAVAGAARQMSVNAPVAADNGLVVASASTAAGNNDIANAVAALQDAPMTGSTAHPVEGWSSLVYTIGTDSSTAKQSSDSHTQVVNQLENLWDQTSGVSIDEEAAMLMRFQRAYEANAKFFQVVDGTIDLLMQLGEV